MIAGRLNRRITHPEPTGTTRSPKGQAKPGEPVAHELRAAWLDRGGRGAGAIVSADRQVVLPILPARRSLDVGS